MAKKTHKLFYKKCPICGNKFSFWMSDIKYGRGKFCSIDCSHINRYGPKLYKKCTICRKKFLARKNMDKMGYSNFCSRKCMGVRNRNEGNPMWKGEEVSYRGIHRYIERKFGKADRCVNPNCSSPNYNKFEWSNISGTYKRDIKDWQMLCIPCHKRYDGVSEQAKQKLRKALSKRKRDKLGRLLPV